MSRKMEKLLFLLLSGVKHTLFEKSITYERPRNKKLFKQTKNMLEYYCFNLEENNLNQKIHI